MTPVIIVIVFLVLFAVLMMAVGLGSRFLEIRGKKQMETILNPVTGVVEERETSILVTPTERDALDAFLEGSNLQAKIQTLLQQAGLQWAPSHLLVAMAVGAVVGAFLGYLIQPLGFMLLSILAFAFVLGGLPLFYVRFQRGNFYHGCPASRMPEGTTTKEERSAFKSPGLVEAGYSLVPNMPA